MFYSRVPLLRYMLTTERLRNQSLKNAIENWLMLVRVSCSKLLIIRIIALIARRVY